MMLENLGRYAVTFFLVVMFLLSLIPSKAEEIEDFEGYVSRAGILYDYSPERFQEALNNGKPTLLEFSADRCGACRMMIPTVRALRTKYKGIADIITVNVDTAEGLQLSRQYGERYLPTFTFFDRYGKPVKKLSGYKEKEEIESVLNKLLRGEKLGVKTPEETSKGKKVSKTTPAPDLTTAYNYEGEVLKVGKGFYEGFLSFGEIFSYENYGLRLIGTDTEKKRAYIDVLYNGKKSPLSGSLNVGRSLDVGEVKLTLLSLTSEKTKVKIELPNSMHYEVIRESEKSSKISKQQELDLMITKEIENYNPIIDEEMSVLLRVENNLESSVQIEVIDTLPEDFEVVHGNLSVVDTLKGGEFKIYSYKIIPHKEGNYEIPNANLIYSDGSDEKIIISEEFSIHVTENLENEGVEELLSSIFDRLLELLGLEGYTI